MTQQPYDPYNAQPPGQPQPGQPQPGQYSPDQYPPPGQYPTEPYPQHGQYPAGQYQQPGQFPPPGGQYPPPPGQYPPAPQTPSNGMGIGALVTGIVSIFLSWCCAPIGGVIPGAVAIVLGALGSGKAKRGEATNGGMALAGMITGGAGIVLSIGFLILAFAIGGWEVYYDI